MKGFILYLLAGKNPANALSDIRGLRGHSALKGLLKTAPAWKVEVVFKISQNQEVLVESLLEWALIESLNTGSHQRVQCPLELRGSGRWCAADRGGRYNALIESVLEWHRLPLEKKDLFTRAEEFFGLRSEGDSLVRLDRAEWLGILEDAERRRAEERALRNERRHAEQKIFENFVQAVDACTKEKQEV